MAGDDFAYLQMRLNFCSLGEIQVIGYLVMIFPLPVDEGYLYPSDFPTSS